jgi:hypothetical protein
MEQLAITDKWRSLLPTLVPHDVDLTEKELDRVLDAHLPKLGDILRKRVKEALAIAAYRTQSSYPVVDLLLCDDAPQFNALTVALALCWIHEYRHYMWIALILGCYATLLIKNVVYSEIEHFFFC